MYEAGLVLEGGGMKGVYTAGVLDLFLDKGLEFSHCYGVSAGACHLCSYLSKQRGRAYHVVVDYLKDRRYCSVYNLFTTGDLFRVDMCYDLIPNYLNPYDYEAFDKYPGKAYAVVTNIESGEAEFIRLKDIHRDIVAVRASASLPLVARNVKIGDHYYLDGGVADSIPIQKSILDGNRKNVVVMTKEVGYRRKPSSQLSLIKLRYAKYPRVYELMKNRHVVYNETLDYLERLEQDGKVFIIRPQHKSNVGRLEKDPARLEALYREGYEEAQSRYEALKAYLDA